MVILCHPDGVLRRRRRTPCRHLPHSVLLLLLLLQSSLSSSLSLTRLVNTRLVNTSSSSSSERADPPPTEDKLGCGVGRSAATRDDPRFASGPPGRREVSRDTRVVFRVPCPHLCPLFHKGPSLRGPWHYWGPSSGAASNLQGVGVSARHSRRNTRPQLEALDSAKKDAASLASCGRVLHPTAACTGRCR